MLGTTWDGPGSQDPNLLFETTSFPRFNLFGSLRQKIGCALNKTTAPHLCMGRNMVLKSAHGSKPIRRAAGAESPTSAFHSATGAEKLKRSFFLAGPPVSLCFLEARSAAEKLKSTLIWGSPGPEILGKVLLLYCCGRCSVTGLDMLISKVHELHFPLVPGK